MIRFILITLIVGGAAIFVVLFSGPHMKVQQNIRSYQAVMPVPPPGMVPVNPTPPLPTTRQAIELTNPVPYTPANAERGRVYYAYYCRQCHGDEGDGYGPVAESYIPRPSNLRAPKIQAYSDGQLLRAMLTGVGHEPVLERTVLPEHRWYLVVYMRLLTKP